MTPSQLKEYEFKTAGRNAYKADDVDDFFAEVAANYTKMFHENGELVRRVGLLADRLEKFKKQSQKQHHFLLPRLSKFLATIPMIPVTNTNTTGLISRK